MDSGIDFNQHCAAKKEVVRFRNTAVPEEGLSPDR